jgi:hypothetical protein
MILEAPPSSPWWLAIPAQTILVLHIAGGGIGILSGAATLLARKGSLLHRRAGTVFFVSMLVAYAIGAGVAPFLRDGQRPNFIAGIMALYLLITGWLAARRRTVPVGWVEKSGLAAALLVAGAGFLFMHMAANSPTGTIDGSPPQAFYVFAISGSFAAAGDLNVILRGGLAGVPRIARHLWRLCFSLFIASGSFFLGQQQVMPHWMQGSPLLYLPTFAPLAAMFYWLVRIRLGTRFRAMAPSPA